MSEPRIISPLLDGFALGSSMSYHSGVNCYPAMRVDSDERYIVKTISIPASQTQLEALLLTGAYPNAEAARGYFQDLARSIRGEVEILDKLATQQGFLPFLGYQIVPLEEGVGFEFYLISYYRRSLERFLRRSPMTHLSAVNMGIDLCAALSVCREAGYLYVDLKPSNIYLSGEQEYHIGDLGFVSLDSLKYASLPDRCRSSWTPPEVSDAYSTLNTTMDTYALGLVLYQVYNNGALPFDSEQSRLELMERLAKGEQLPAPAYADYEMAQIILKACAYDPAERWQDPKEMGHALIAYMQRNGANDVPIAPPVVSEPSLTIEIPSEEIYSDEADMPGGTEEGIPSGGETPEEEPEESGIPEAEAEDAEESWLDRMDAYLSEDSEGEETDEDTMTLRQILSEDDLSDDTNDADGLEEQELSEDIASILSQADELIAHEAPEPAVAPEPIDIPMPEPIVLESEEEEDVPEDDLPLEPGEDPAVDADEEDGEDEPYEKTPPSGRGKKLLRWVIAILILALLGAGCYYGYNEYILQEIGDITVTGEGDQMSVAVVTDMDMSKLTVVCVDLYGNKQQSKLTDGVATFTGLTADTQYNISLEVEGLHKLTGKTTAQFYTLPQTSVTGFTAVTGPEDGSVILTFTTEGPEVANWTLEYAAQGQAPMTASFTGNTFTVPGLVPGTEYTFTLSTEDEVQLIGQTQLIYTASAVIYAQDLSVTGSESGSISASWAAPEGVSVESWTARCYNESGYDQVLTVTEPTATFTGVDSSTEYTVEVTAAGMTQSTRTYVTANPITVTAVKAEALGTDSLAVSWEFEGTSPETGWLLLYTVDQGTEQHVIQCTEPIGVIEPVAPGSHYDFTIQAANVSVFGGTASADVPAAESFSNYGVTASDITVTLCATPSADGWDYSDISDNDVTSTFAVGETAGVMLRTTTTYNIDYNTVTTVFVVRDAEGKLACISSSSDTWDNMWYNGHCDLSIPTLPAVPGSYTLEIYIAGQLLSAQSLTIE